LAQEDDERSRSNPGEAKIVAEHVSRLISAGVPAKDVAVVTPYNLQVFIYLFRIYFIASYRSTVSLNYLRGREW